VERRRLWKPSDPWNLGSKLSIYPIANHTCWGGDPVSGVIHWTKVQSSLPHLQATICGRDAAPEDIQSLAIVWGLQSLRKFTVRDLLLATVGSTNNHCPLDNQRSLLPKILSGSMTDYPQLHKPLSWKSPPRHCGQCPQDP
jgi:hypothetical protein